MQHSGGFLDSNCNKMANTKTFRLQRNGSRSPKRKKPRKAKERDSRALIWKRTIEQY